MKIDIEDTALMADLMLGSGLGADLSYQVQLDKSENLLVEARHLREVIARLRQQIKQIIVFRRALIVRHERLSHPAKLKYSTFEILLCKQDLRQMWALYRHAVRSFHKAHLGSLATMHEIGTDKLPNLNRRRRAA